MAHPKEARDKLRQAYIFDQQGLEFAALQADVHHLSVRKVYQQGIITNLLNPKVGLFFLAFLPQFIPANSTHVLAPMLLLSAIFMLMTLAVFVVYGLLAHTFRHFVVESARVQTFLRYGFTAAFIGLASKLALTDK